MMKISSTLRGWGLTLLKVATLRARQGRSERRSGEFSRLPCAQ